MDCNERGGNHSPSAAGLLDADPASPSRMFVPARNPAVWYNGRMSLAELEAAVEQVPEQEYAAFVAWLTERSQTKQLIQGTGIAAAEKPRRPFGLYAGQFTVPDDFDDPLPEEILRSFEGE